jgi:hypothetical protein
LKLGFALASAVFQANAMLRAVVGAGFGITCFASPALLACTQAVDTVTVTTAHKVVGLGDCTLFLGAVGAKETFRAFTAMQSAAALSIDLVALVFAQGVLAIVTHPAVKAGAFIADASVTLLGVLQADTMVTAGLLALRKRAVIVEIVAKTLADAGRGITFSTGGPTTMTVVDTAEL